MAKVKVWLIVCITVALAGFFWSFRAKQDKEVRLLKRQVAIQKASNALRRAASAYQQSLLKRTQEIAQKKGLRYALKPLAETGLSKWREDIAHRKAARQLKKQRALLEGAPASTEMYLFSHTRRTLMKSSKVKARVSSQTNKLAKSPLVELALRGKACIGTWSENNRPYLIASAPIYSRAQDHENSDNEDLRKIVGVLLAKQALSRGLFAKLSSKATGSSAPLLVLFHQAHPLFYHTPPSPSGSLSKQTQTASAPPLRRVNSEVSASMTPLRRELQKWTVHRFSALKRELRSGSSTSPSPVFFAKQPYLYQVGSLPTKISNMQLGFVLFQPATQSSLSIYRSPFFMVTALGIFFAILLGAWLSLSTGRQSRQLRKVVTEFAEDPRSLRSVQQLPSSFNFLFQPMRKIAQTLNAQEGAVNRVLPTETETPEEPLHHPTFDSIEMIRALREDGSMMLPPKPQSMTYNHKPEKDPIEALAKPQGLMLQASENSELPVFVTLGEGQPTASSHASRSPDLNPLDAETPSLAVEVSAPIAEESEPITSSPSSLPGLAEAPRQPLQDSRSLKNQAIDTPPHQPEEERGPISASSLPMYIEIENGVPNQAGSNRSLVFGDAVGSLTSELDNVFSMIAESEPSSSASTPQAAPKTGQEKA